LAWLDPLLVRVHTVCSPVFHCYSCPLATFACPIGVLANFSAIHLIPFVAVGTLAIVGAAVGSFVCGWACPFGFLQDLAARIPTPKVHLPSWMGYFRYVVLVVFVLAIPFLFGDAHPLFFCRLCPAGALEAALPYTASLAAAGKEIVWPTATKLTILGLLAAAALFTWRPWCTLFCPLGAIYGLANHVSLFYLRFHPDRCRDCELCRDMCDHRGPSQRRASQMRCIRCLDCTKCSAVTVSSVIGRVEASATQRVRASATQAESKLRAADP
jgi:ferredoxin-type protein NapH